MSNDPSDAERCDPGAPRSTNYAREIDQSTQVLRQEAGVASQFFIFPYDVCSPAALERLKAQGYLGARCGDQSTQFNGSAFPDGFRLQFDVWGPAYSHYGQSAPCEDVQEYVTPPRATSRACRLQVLNRYVDDTIARKGWALREFHGFDDDGTTFEPVSVADYEAHLDHLQALVKDGRLWVEGPTEVLRYRFAREKCAAPTVAGAKLAFAAPASECRKYATRLTYTLTTSDDPATLGAQQAGKPLPVRKIGPSTFLMDADPTAGDVTLP